MTVVLVLLAGLLLGVGMAFVSPWLPMLLASIFMFLAAMTCGLAVGDSFLRAFGSAALAMILLQVSYVAAGRLLEGQARGMVQPDNLSSEE